MKIFLFAFCQWGSRGTGGRSLHNYIVVLFIFLHGKLNNGTIAKRKQKFLHGGRVCLECLPQAEINGSKKYTQTKSFPQLLAKKFVF